MKHFIDKISTIGVHRIEAGVIVNSKGQQVGRVAIRYTKSNIGQNKEAGIALNHDVKESVTFATTVKTNTYGTPLQDVMSLNNLIALFSNSSATGALSDGFVSGFKLGNSIYKILWAV